MKEITLPNNWFGVLVMLFALLIGLCVAFVVPYWLLSIVAPWWVSVPVGLMSCVIYILRSVKLRTETEGG